MKRARKALVCGFVAVLAGLIALLTPVEPILAGLSFDFPFLFRSEQSPDDIVVLYMDEASERELGQKPNETWDSKLHARLLGVLKAQKARGVLFDVIFHESPSANRAVTDRDFVEAVRRSGNVTVAANVIRENLGGSIPSVSLDLPFEALRKAAMAWGNAQFPKELDLAIRRHQPTIFDLGGEAEIPSLTRAFASGLGLLSKRGSSRGIEDSWINYYGPPGTLRGLSYYQALLPDGVPPGFFEKKYVFIGARQSVGFRGSGKDEFSTAFTRWTGRQAPGVEIHATAFANLLFGDALTRMPKMAEALLSVLVGLGLGSLFARFKPLGIVALSVVAGLLFVTLGVSCVWMTNTWFSWAILALVQVPTAALCAIVMSSLGWYVERMMLVESLALHVSPARAKQILQHPELLKPSAEKQEVSILFSDIAGFSTIANRTEPEKLFKTLNRYFEETIGSIHDADGTVVKLIGDAIFAIWNAPERQANHQAKACEAALQLNQKVLRLESHTNGLPLRTRVGLHSGVACVGNCGSSQRFDYTAIGTSINLASRLEGMNKLLGTDILASEDIIEAAGDAFLCRCVGFFKPKGSDLVLNVYELLGKRDSKTPQPAWLGHFSEGLKCFQRTEFHRAITHFQDTLLVKPQDGPSLFYLKLCERYLLDSPPEGWLGEVALDEK